MRERKEQETRGSIAAFTEERLIHFAIDRQRQHADYTWFRGEHCNFNPKQKNLRSARDVTSHVLRGWIPETPLIGPETHIAAFGSCFAQHISDWLSQRNFSILTRKDGDYSSAYVVRFGEGMVNTFALRQQFEWAFEGRRFEGELWHGYDARAFGYDEDVRVATRSVFDQTDLFIITLGLSEVWYDSVTGGVFWRAVPRDKYDPTRHKFRVSSVDENRENIRAIYRLVRAHRPEAKIIFTLSPIPLVATFRPVPSITANSVSKAILRAALDEVLRDIQHEGHAYYWPSYEIIMDVFDRQWVSDRRHVKVALLDFVMTMFETHWCRGEPRMTPEEAWARARAATNGLPRALEKPWIAISGRWARGRAQIKNRQLAVRPPTSTVVGDSNAR
jgi:GSCFA family protein